MKKILSLILAAIMAVGIAIPAFAVDEVTTVDNTFDNFTPAPGTKAPDNWYDPYCYDENGHITPAALGTAKSECAYYCRETGKLFTMGCPAIASNGQRYFPYKTRLTFIIADGSEIIAPAYYCPYCGIAEDKDVFYETHEAIKGVKFGSYCPICGEFNVEWCCFDENNNINKRQCRHCGEFYYPVEFYRFLTEEQRTADYAFIFAETADQYVGGVDGKLEDVVVNSDGDAVYNPWHPEEAPEEELEEPTLKDKFVAFFKKIGDFFTRIWLWFINLFK